MILVLNDISRRYAGKYIFKEMSKWHINNNRLTARISNPGLTAAENSSELSDLALLNSRRSQLSTAPPTSHSHSPNRVDSLSSARDTRVVIAR